MNVVSRWLGMAFSPHWTAMSVRNIALEEAAEIIDAHIREQRNATGIELEALAQRIRSAKTRHRGMGGSE